MASITKICTKCGEEKDRLNGFYFYSNGWIRSPCKDCIKELDKQKDPVAHRKRVKLWKQNNSEKHKKQAKRYKQQERVKSVLRNKAKIYRKNHPDVVSAQNVLRRARLSGADGSHSYKEWTDLCKKYNYVCLMCKEKKPLTRDHIIPLSKGGTNFIENIQPLCLSCNSRKGIKTIDYR